VKIRHARTGQELLTLKGHPFEEQSIAFSPDGNRIASGGFHSVVKVWDGAPVPGTVLRKRALVSNVNSLSEKLLFREDVCASLRKDRTLSNPERAFALEVAQSRSENPAALNEAAWQVVRTTGLTKEEYTLALRRAECAVKTAAGDGMYLSTLGVAQYRMGRYADALATLAESEKLNTMPLVQPADIAFQAMAHHRLAHKAQGDATLARLRETMKHPRWVDDFEAQSFLREAETLIRGGHQGRATCVAYSPGGKHAITGGFDRTLCLWSLEDGKEVRRFEGHTNIVWTVAFTRDGSRVISGSQDNTVRVWSVETGRELRRLNGHLATISSVGFLPDGKHALSGSWDKTVRLWDIETGNEVRQLRVAAPVLSVAISADGKHALFGSNDGWLRYWELWKMKEVKYFKGPAGMIEGVALTKEDRTAIVAGADAAIHIYSIATGNEEKTLEGHGAKVDCDVLSPDGLRILSSGEDKTLKLWDLASRRLLWIGSCVDKVRQVAFSPDGKRAVSACYDGSMGIWELPR
jgi:WD40 repeat protein